ncbi:NAD-dependent epimerase/dehydratase family protein [Ectopseudomonas oleovorans]|uniref:NAD-dependent epimerase/dehydratase n=1 Tax=Ectopseudomonas oleovorans (strain CECT 5344) TaxID=1182590 RepID=W6QTS6_ECTO5|nr:NAD-dependent epimerase/dehydratase family protein [Pseudomonas oleovorans]CDM40290.1 NAD-dependent epimerase/dehydratase [Pseudomonas oleovorans CECT 5344]CDR90920.1 NAD-dependent epimerase/dehydratase [Pseudomonas oleovorans]
MQVLVSGANGLVGTALISRIAREPALRPIAGLREPQVDSLLCEQRVLGDLAKGRVAAQVVHGVDVVVHVAARVHVMQENELDSLAAFRAINVEGTRALLEASSEANVRRFVFVSSIKVNGEASLPGRPFSEEDGANPQDAYAHSKWEAEQLVQGFCEQHGMEWVIVRPPLVYGPGVRANFRRMMQALARGFPLPLGGLHNKRSLVALENLADFLTCCVSHPLAANQRFLVSDGRDLSVTELSRALAAALGSRSWLIPLPGTWLAVGLRLMGRAAAAQRLCGELRVDSGKARTLLHWQEPQGVDEALAATVQDFVRGGGQ